jgi:molybdopterin synthase catalytic subunit
VFAISRDALKPEELKQPLLNAQAGGYVAFEGWVRNHNDGRSVLTLEYEAFEPLCLKEAERILVEAKQRFDIYDCACVHRVGALTVGDMAVWVGVTAAHRGTAFDACQFVIDEIKSRLPIWKKETYTDGSSDWVNCQQGCGTHSHKKNELPAAVCGEGV